MFQTRLLTVFSVFRRGDLPFNVRRAIPRGGLESDEESEAKSETPEPKPEWTTAVPCSSSQLHHKHTQTHTSAPAEPRGTHVE